MTAKGKTLSPFGDGDPNQKICSKLRREETFAIPGKGEFKCNNLLSALVKEEKCKSMFLLLLTIHSQKNDWGLLLLVSQKSVTKT